MKYENGNGNVLKLGLLIFRITMVINKKTEWLQRQRTSNNKYNSCMYGVYASNGFTSIKIHSYAINLEFETRICRLSFQTV